MEQHQMRVRLGARKRFFSRGWLGTGTGSRGSGHDTELPEFKKCFDNALRNTVLFLSNPVWSKELDSPIVVVPY